MLLICFSLSTYFSRISYLLHKCVTFSGAFFPCVFSPWISVTLRSMFLTLTFQFSHLHTLHTFVLRFTSYRCGNSFWRVEVEKGSWRAMLSGVSLTIAGCHPAELTDHSNTNYFISLKLSFWVVCLCVIPLSPARNTQIAPLFGISTLYALATVGERTDRYGHTERQRAPCNFHFNTFVVIVPFDS